MTSKGDLTTGLSFTGTDILVIDMAGILYMPLCFRKDDLVESCTNLMFFCYLGLMVGLAYLIMTPVL